MRARSKGVCRSLSLAAAVEQRAVRVTSRLEGSDSVPVRGEQQSHKSLGSFDEPLSPVLDVPKRASKPLGLRLSDENRPSCETSLTLLVAARPLKTSTSLPPECQTKLAVSTAARRVRSLDGATCRVDDGWQPDLPMQDSFATGWLFSSTQRDIEFRQFGQSLDELFRSSSAFEQSLDFLRARSPISVTRQRTRKLQRVLHEERNARQCFAARREPHCDY